MDPPGRISPPVPLPTPAGLHRGGDRLRLPGEDDLLDRRGRPDHQPGGPGARLRARDHHQLRCAPVPSATCPKPHLLFPPSSGLLPSLGFGLGIPEGSRSSISLSVAVPHQGSSAPRAWPWTTCAGPCSGRTAAWTGSSGPGWTAPSAACSSTPSSSTPAPSPWTPSEGEQQESHRDSDTGLCKVQNLAVPRPRPDPAHPVGGIGSVPQPLFLFNNSGFGSSCCFSIRMLII